MKVAVLYGGESAESEISKKSAESVVKALKRLGHQTFEVELTPDAPLELAKIKPDKAFLALHGSPGEDGTVQGMLEIMKIPYTGCGVLSSAVSMDKDVFKRIAASHSITVPSGITLFEGEELPKTAEFPCIVKPSRGGSSIATFLVKNEAELERAVKEAFKIDEKVLIEEFIEGREITVPVLNGKALPAVEINFPGRIYDYEAKYSSPTTKYTVPAPLGERLGKRLSKIAEKVFKVFECKGAVRVDFRVDEFGVPYLLELNTIPGLTERSLLPMAAEAAGMSFERLIEEMLRS